MLTYADIRRWSTVRANANPLTNADACADVCADVCGRMHQALVDASRECDGKFWSETEYTDKACGQCSVRRAAWGGCTTAEKYVCRELEFVMAGLLTGVEVQAAAEGACESILVAAATVEAKRVVVELWGAAERLAEDEEAEEVQAALLQVC